MKRSKSVIIFDTYPDMFLDNDCRIENDRYDNTVRYFSVPVPWVSAWVKKQYGINLGEFWMEYTWDNTFDMYTDAVSENTLLKSTICNR